MDEVDAVLVTELSRWGRSTLDLLQTLKELETRRVSVIAMNGLTPYPEMCRTRVLVRHAVVVAVVLTCRKQFDPSSLSLAVLTTRYQAGMSGLV